jgi:hypothetical protein
MSERKPDPEQTWAAWDYVNRGQRITLLSVAPPFIREMKKEWGSDWLARLNRARRERDLEVRKRYSNSPVREGLVLDNGELHIEFSELCRLVIDTSSMLAIFRGRSREVRLLAKEAREVRNDQFHYTTRLDPNDIKRAERYLNTLAQFAAIVAGEEAATTLRSLKKEMVDWIERRIEMPAAPQELSSGDIAEIKSLLQELRAKQAAPLEPEQKSSPASDATYQQDSADAGGTMAGEPARHRTADAPAANVAAAPAPPRRRRRRSAIPSPRPGLALFPVVDELDESANEIFYLQCDQYEPTHREPSVLKPNGLATLQANRSYSIVDAARHNEENAERATLHVRARFDSNVFDGPSFGLALVIGDRSARYGYSDANASIYIIATGEIPKDGQGEVCPIDGFAAKVRLLQREAPAGSLFLFPAANLESASPETRQALERAKESGAFSWRAVSHVRELEDLFAGAPMDNRLAAKGLPTQAEAEQAVPEPVIVEGVAAQQRRRSRNLLRPLLGSVAAGVLLLVGIYGVSVVRERYREDPVLEQAAREHLEAVKKLADAIPLVPDSARACRDLIEATQRFSSAERQAVNAGTLIGTAASERCSAALTDSDRRWAALAAADHPSANAEEAIAATRTALTAFDLSRADEDGKSALLSRTEEAGKVLAASNARLKALDDAAAESLQARTAEYDAELVAAEGGLQPKDRLRLSAKQKAHVSLAKDASARLSASELRLAAVTTSYERLLQENSEPARRALRSALRALDAYDKARVSNERMDTAAAALADGPRLIALGLIAELGKAVDDYRQAPGDETIRAMSAAAHALSPEDRALMTVEQKKLLDTVRDGELATLQSDNRLQALINAERTLEGARASGKGLLPATKALISAARSLSDFDRSRLNAEHSLALASAGQANADLAAGKAHIDDVVSAAEIVLIAQGRASEEMRATLSRSYAALTPLDFERMEPSQTAVVNRACSIRPQQMSGSIRPINSCILPTIHYGPRVLAPAIPLR